MSSKPMRDKASMWRRLAEERLADRSDPPASPPGDGSSARILHELLVHQVELEMQNEELLEARIELEVNSERFTELYDFAPVGYFSLAAKGHIKQLNFMGAHMLGGEQAKLLKKRFSDFLSAADGQRFDSFCSRIFSGDKAESCEVQITRHGESPITIRLTGVLSPNGQVCRIAAMDVTVDALRISEEKFRSIFEFSPMAMYLYHLAEDGRLILSGANSAADRETGISHGMLHGKTLEEAFPALVGTDIPQMYKDVARGTLDTHSFIIRYDDQKIAGHFDVRVFQTGPGTIVVAFMDISDRMKVQEALRKSQEELELRVQRRTAQLQERSRQLRALASELTLAEERERRRIAQLIHDHLQQMLVAAVLNTGMLKSKLTDDSCAADLDHIERILRDSIETTRSLTTELSPAVLHQCGLAAALKWLRLWCIDKYGLTLEVEVDDEVLPDLDVSVTLFLCVRELLFNIVKHSGVKSAGLRMWQTPHDRSVGIEVSDKGKGFDPKVVRAREGTTGGFGLFHIRERLELLGGGLQIESSPGSGSRFTLRVPPPVAPVHPWLQAASAMETTAGPVDALPCCHALRKTRLLVADDHAAVREGLVRLFQAESDMEVVGQAADGVEAVQLARELRPHFVVMDLNMPRMDGLEATAAIRHALPCVRVLGLSTYADEQHRDAMIRAGAVDLLHKNISASQLVTTLRSYAKTPCCPESLVD